MRRILAMGVLALAAAAVVGRTEARAVPERQAGQSIDAVRADALAEQIERLPGTTPDADRQLIVDGFAAFIERMDAFDGPRATRLAHGMHAHANAVWSVFCLEGALRRAAPADADLAAGAFDEADTALLALLSTGAIGRDDAVALTLRRAILAAGFGRDRLERAALGRALAAGGIDGAQITGLSALTRGDSEAASRLFGSLLDAEHPPEALAWSVRGHGLACLELLRQPPAH